MLKSYPILTTDAFIIHTRATGEADRVITALTKENGLMNLYARGIRKDGAKMRGGAKPYARVSVSVILSRRTILKDITITNTLDQIWNNKQKYTAFVALLRCLRTLIPITESYDENVFHTVETATELLQKSQQTHVQHILLIAQVMLLTTLGYVPDQNIVPTQFTNILKETIANPHRQKELQQHLKNALYHQ